MYHCAIVFFPEINLGKIQAFREKYDPQFKVLPPHITVVFPFDGQEEEIIRHLSEVANNFSKFSIRLSGFTKSFDNFSQRRERRDTKIT